MAKITKSFLNFSGGENLSTSKYALEENQVRKATNFIVFPNEALSRRKGYTKVTTGSVGSAISLQDTFIYYSPAQVLAAGRTPVGTSFYTVGSDLTEITGGSTFGFNTPDMYEFRDYSLFFDGTAFDYSSDNLTKSTCGYTAGTSELVPSLMAASDDRLFIVDPRYPNSLFYTDYDGYTTDPSDWNFATNNEIPIPDRSADTVGITNILSVGVEDSLLIFRENDVWKLLGEGINTYTLRRINSPSGCVSRDGAVVTARGDVVFVGNGNIYEYGDSGIVPIGNDIRDLIKGKDLSNAKTVYDPYYDIVIIGWEDQSLIWNCTPRSWTEFDIPVSSFIRFMAASEDNVIYFTKPGDGNVYKLFDSELDNGEDISWEIRSRDYVLGGFHDPVQLRDMKFLVDSNKEEPFELKAYADFETIRDVTATQKLEGLQWNVGRWNIDQWAAGTNVAIIQGEDDNAKNQDAKGHSISFTLSQTGSDALTLYAVDMILDAKLRRYE